MRNLIILALITLLASATMAQIPHCKDYSGVPRPISSLFSNDNHQSLVAAGNNLCTISDNFNLQGWSLGPNGLPQLGGLLEPVDGRFFSQLAVHGNRIFASTGYYGIVIHQMIDATPVPVDSILVTRTSSMVTVANDLLITNRGSDLLLFFDLAGFNPGLTPVLTDSLQLPNLAPGGAHSADGLVLVQTTLPPRAHVLDAATRQILGTVEIPWNTGKVSWDGRLALLHNVSQEETLLLDATDLANPALLPLPPLGDSWLLGGTLVDDHLWLSGCDFEHGGILARFDMTDPNIPVYLGMQPSGGSLTEAVIVDGCVHALTTPIPMCTHGPPALDSILIGSPHPLPERFGYLQDNDLDSVDQAALTGDLLCRTAGQALQIVDFSDPATPLLISDTSLPESLMSEHIHTNGTHVVIAGSGSGGASVGGRIFVYDISTPETPLLQSTLVCMRFSSTALDGDRLYTFGVDDDLYVWQLENNGTVTLLMQHTSLTSNDFTKMLAYGDFLFTINNWYDFQGWNFSDPLAPFELTDLPSGEVYDFTWLKRWDGGIHWFGRTGLHQYSHELMTIEPAAPWTVRLLWRTESESSTGFWNTGLVDAGDRMYLSGGIYMDGGPGILALDLQSDPPALLGLIPSFWGVLRLINGCPVVEDYHSFQVWAPACCSLSGSFAALPQDPNSIKTWPNPFNPLLNVEFALPEAGTVAVAVFDLRGRRLRTLTRGLLGEGRHILQWDGCDDTGRIAAAGVYVVRLEQAGRKTAQRVTLVK